MAQVTRTSTCLTLYWDCCLVHYFIFLVPRRSPYATCRGAESAHLRKQPCIWTRFVEALKLHAAGLPHCRSPSFPQRASGAPTRTD